MVGVFGSSGLASSDRTNCVACCSVGRHVAPLSAYPCQNKEIRDGRAVAGSWSLDRRERSFCDCSA
jgi:hypothetical protein